MLTFIKSLSPVLVMIGSMSEPICNRFHDSEANDSKIKNFRGTPLSHPCSMGTPSPKSTKLCREKLESLWQTTVKIS